MAASTKPSTMLSCLPFVVDTWTARNSLTSKPHFLTHCHKDHTEGIADCAVDVYCTDLTRRLLLLRQPEAGRANRFHVLEPGACVEVTYGPVSFSVTALDANHCPGSAMFLFQGCFGNILHTGDCRLTPDVVRCIQEALGSGCEGGCGCENAAQGVGGAADSAQDGGCCPCCGAGDGGAGAERIDLLYLDCTFADLPLDFPSRNEAVQQAEQLIRARGAAPGGGSGGSFAALAAAGSAPAPAAVAVPHSLPGLRRVFLSADLLGTESLLSMVGATFRQPLFVPPPERHKEYGFANPDLVRQRRRELAVLLPHLALSDDPACTFHLHGIRDFAHRGRAGAGVGCLQQAGQRQRRGPRQERSSGSRAMGAGMEDDEDQGEEGEALGAPCSALEAAEANAGGAGCLYVRASTQIFAQKIREQYQRPSQLLAARTCAPAPTAAVQERAVHYVLYSAHSSRRELAAALAALRPRATRPIAADMVGCVAAVVAERMGSERPEAVEAEVAERMAWAMGAEANGLCGGGGDGSGVGTVVVGSGSGGGASRLGEMTAALAVKREDEEVGGAPGPVLPHSGEHIVAEEPPMGSAPGRYPYRQRASAAGTRTGGSQPALQAQQAPRTAAAAQVLLSAAGTRRHAQPTALAKAAAAIAHARSVAAAAVAQRPPPPPPPPRTASLAGVLGNPPPPAQAPAATVGRALRGTSEGQLRHPLRTATLNGLQWLGCRHAKDCNGLGAENTDGRQDTGPAVHTAATRVMVRKGPTAVKEEAVPETVTLLERQQPFKQQSASPHSRSPLQPMQASAAASPSSQPASQCCSSPSRQQPAAGSVVGVTTGTALLQAAPQSRYRYGAELCSGKRRRSAGDLAQPAGDGCAEGELRGQQESKEQECAGVGSGGIAPATAGAPEAPHPRAYSATPLCASHAATADPVGTYITQSVKGAASSVAWLAALDSPDADGAKVGLPSKTFTHVSCAVPFTLPAVPNQAGQVLVHGLRPVVGSERAETLPPIRGGGVQPGGFLTALLDGMSSDEDAI